MSQVMSQAPEQALAGWQGHLQLDFSQVGQATQMSRCHVQAPLKVQRPFYPEGESVCHVAMLHTAGGIVGGDRLSVDVRLNPGAHAVLTTATAGKLYRSNGLESTQTIHLTAAPGACLEWLPQEMIVFEGARFRQQVRVELGAGALWFGWEVLRFGRSARGEGFAAGSWRSRTEVWQDGRLLWVDPQWLLGESEMLKSPHGLAGCPVVGSFAVVGRSVERELVEKARSLWQGNLQDVSMGDRPAPTAHSSEVGVTRLMNGMLCRYRGKSTQEARQWFTQVWHLLRAELLGRSPCVPRIWQL